VQANCASSTAPTCRVAKTKAEREATEDGRLSLEERYKSSADYAAEVRAAAEALTRDGYMLPEEVERISAKAVAATW
jgi:hypothetical protein